MNTNIIPGIISELSLSLLMEQMQRLVETYLATQRIEEIESIVFLIDNGSATLLVLVKALGSFLTSEVDQIRKKGVQLLSSVLERANHSKINRNTTHVLTEFYCDKLEDEGSIDPALKGLVALSKLPNFGSEEVNQLVNRVSNLDVRTYGQGTRHAIFQIIDILMKGHRQTLLSMGSKFTAAWLRIATGEKDPRNLMIAFAIYRVVLIEFPIADHIEDLFDSTFCYLPITFRPSPNDPYGITSDDLINALRSVVSATPEFGPKAIPLCLEKLTIGSPNIRRDIMQTLSVTLPVYGPGIASEFANDIWKLIKIEIFQPTDKLVETDALGTIQTLIKTIYSDIIKLDEKITAMSGLIADICDECADVLREPDRSQSKAAVRIVASLIQTTPTVSQYVLSQILPPLLSLFLSTPTARPAILSCLTEFLGAVHLAEGEWKKHQHESGQPSRAIDSYKDQILGALAVGLRTSNSKKNAINAFMNALDLEEFVTDEEVGFMVHNINEVTFGADSLKEVLDGPSWRPSLKLLQKISAITPSHLENTTLPLLFGALPDVPPKNAQERENAWLVLGALEELCLPPPLFQLLVVRLLAKIDIVCGVRYQVGNIQTVDCTGIGREEKAAYSHSMLLTLANVLTTKNDRQDPDVQKYVKELMERIYNLFILSALQENCEMCVATHIRLLQVGAQLGTLIAQSSSESQQAAMFERLYRIFFRGELNSIPAGQWAGSTFLPFQKSAHLKNSTLLFCGPLLPLRPGALLPEDDLQAFLTRLLVWSFEEAEGRAISRAIHQVVGSILNKKAEDLAEFISKTVQDYWNQYIVNAAQLKESRIRALDGWLWISRALVCRNHPSAIPLAEQLFMLFDEEDIGWEAGRVLGLIAASNDALTKKNFAVIKVLYVQRFTNSILPQIVNRAQGPTSQSQVAALVALTTLIKAVPRSIYQNELQRLMPLMLRGLDLPEAGLRTNVLDTLNDAISDDLSQLIGEYASNLVTIMLKMSKTPQNSTKMASSIRDETRLQISALKFLGTLPGHVRYNILHPQRATVIRSLGEVLDDPRRSVRSQAVEARAAWYTKSNFLSDLLSKHL